MAKALSPIRIQDDLMESAKTVGYLMHRSAAEQIEYWATLGQKISNKLTPETLLSINAGLMKISVKPVTDPIVDFDSLLEEVEHRSNSGELTESITNGRIRYQASKNHPALLEKVDVDGNITLGKFKSGLFIQSCNDEFANHE